MAPSGTPTVIVQVDGSTSLIEAGNEFFLYTGGTGPSLKYGGTPVNPGEFGGWTRSARSRRRAAMRSPGKWPEGTNTRSGAPIAVAITCRI